MEIMHKSNLTLDELMVFNSEIRSVEKSAAIAYLMLIGGHLGVHRFYLKRKVSAIVQLTLFLVAALGYVGLTIASAIENTPLLIITIILFGLPALALFIWIVVDLFMISGMVREYNEKQEYELLKQIFEYRNGRNLG